MDRRALWIGLLAVGCGARSTMVDDPDGSPLDELDAGAERVEHVDPDAGGSQAPTLDPIGECEATGARGLTMGEPTSLSVANRSVHLSSMARGPEGVLAVLEDRYAGTFRIATLSEDGRQAEPGRLERDGVGARIAWSAAPGSYALAFLEPDAGSVQFEEFSTSATGSGWRGSELTVGEGAIAYLVGPVFAANDWVVGWRTIGRAVARTVTSVDDGGWAFEHSFGADLALTADPSSGVTWVALYQRDRPLQIVQIGPDGVPVLTDPTVTFDPPIVGVDALSPADAADLFVLGQTGPDAAGHTERCLARTGDTDALECLTLLAFESRPAVLTSAVLDTRVREMACAAIEHGTRDDGAVIDLSCAIDWRDGSTQRFGQRVDVADADDGLSYPDGNELFGTPWGGLDIVPVSCGYLVAWGDENMGGRIGTVVLRLSP